MSMNFYTKIRTGKLNILVIHERKFVLCTKHPVQHLRILFIFLQFLHHRSSEEMPNTYCNISQCTLFQITVPLSCELSSALSDKEREQDTRDVTLANEDDGADDTRAAGTVDPCSERSSPHGRSRGSCHSRETRAL